MEQLPCNSGRSLRQILILSFDSESGVTTVQLSARFDDVPILRSTCEWTAVSATEIESVTICPESAQTEPISYTSSGYDLILFQSRGATTVVSTYELQ